MKKRKKKAQNTSPAYWEAQLRKRGLGVNQPMTDNSGSDESMAQLPTSSEDDMASLRNIFGGDDQFMEGHQLTKVRSLEREIPAWALDDKEVQKILLSAFPKLRTSLTQRNAAARWARVIYLYYRMALPQQIVMREMGLAEYVLKNILQRIKSIAEGKTSARGRRKGGTPQTASEGTGE